MLVQSVASDVSGYSGYADTTSGYADAPRLIPAGHPGVQAATVIALGRAILLSRLIVATVYAVLAVALNGTDSSSLQRFALPFLLIAVVTFAELRVLPKVAPGPPRIALVLADSAVALVIFLVWTADPVYVIFQIGAAALAGALLGLHGTPLWVGQAIQAAATCWVVLDGKVAPPAVTVLLVVAPALIVAAGASAVTLTRIVQDRLVRDLDPELPVSEIYHRACTTLRTASLAVLRIPRREPRLLVDDLARTLTQDTATARQRAGTPVNGIRFDRPHEDFSDPLALLCHQWINDSRTGLQTDLAPVWLRIPVRHQLALIVDDALSNITGHAHATRAQVELAERRHVVTITVKDNGQGFTVPTDPEVLHGGDFDGLCRMISRSSYLGADLSITTAPHSGTEITVRMSA